MKKLLGLVAIALIVGLLFGGDDEEATPSSASVTHERVIRKVLHKPSPACEIGQPGSGDVIAVTGEYHPRQTPSEDGAPIKNEKASRIFKSVQYHQIDSSTTVRQLCVQRDWSKVQIVEPDWLTFVKGWVPNKVLRGIQRTADGGRVYVEADFYWDDDTSKFKPQIVRLVNEISHEHAGCSSVGTSSVALSPSRSKPNDPVFFVTCNPSSGAPFNVWFRPSDAGKAFTATTPISESDAVIACEQAAKAAATHPSTVDFSRIMDVAYSARQDGRVALDSTFTAKNAFNLELRYRIRCLFDGKAMVESTVVEAR